MSPLTKITSAFKDQRQYYREDRDSIAEENLSTLRIAGFVGTIVALLCFVITPIIIKGWSITTEYTYVVPILVMAYLFSLYFKIRKTTPKPLAVEIACALFYASLLTVFIALSVFPYPNTPQIFISLCYMFMPVLLIVRPSVLFSIMLTAEIVFVWLACGHKTAFSIENDIFNTMVAFIFAMIIMTITNRLRRRNYFVRMKLQRLSETDMLTGILNKKAFEGRCEEFMNALAKPKACALFVLDMDDFKRINDTYGHPVGDELLREVGYVLIRAFRQTDFIGRIGGDEFGVMMRGSIDEASLRKRCELLHDRFRKIVVNGEPLPASCSIGIVYAFDDSYTYPELFRLADEALYEVKRGEKGKEVLIMPKRSADGKISAS